MRFRIVHHLIEALFHHVAKAFVDFALAPEKSLTVLHPLKIADGDSPGVAKDVGNNEDSFFPDDGVGVPGGRAVRAFTKDAAIKPVGVLRCNLVFRGSRYEYFAWTEENLLGWHRLAAAGKLCQ